MVISAGQVKSLRDKTGVGFMECKQALIEANGDEEKAILWLRERGMSRAAKKAERAVAEGLVGVQINSESNVGVLVEVNCETDFVSKNEEFKDYVSKVSELALTGKIDNIDTLATTKMQNGVSAADNLTQLIAKIGENMKLNRVAVVTAKNGVVAGYSHLGSKIGTLVAIEGSTSDKAKEVARDIAMQVAAASPRYLDRSQVNASELEQEKDLARKQLLEQGKPEAMIDKILVGQMNKFYSEVCLVDQAYIKDPKVNVTQFLKDSGEPLTISSYKRFQLGVK